MRSLFNAVMIMPLFFSRISAGTEILHDFQYGMANHIIPRIVAKEICSCLYNSKVPLEICKRKIGLPRFLTKTPIILLEERDGKRLVHAQALFPGVSIPVFHRATATFDPSVPQEGCFISQY